eukprot:CAMPEP_0168616618 /NCGR_PEP_ID=MMETSP0449_2-20121227/5118_1 /TAXON_ID=1082188 /ORGANISM="Strombidium rassoulzadegani, Strain ras09" /LENGTH=74 /DNA_ID=CAMNT_0008657405 /DNA_START=755 /DNA_END=979 /DNA_ORIENTATION=-
MASKKKEQVENEKLAKDLEKMIDDEDFLNSLNQLDQMEQEKLKVQIGKTETKPEQTQEAEPKEVKETPAVEEVK